MPRRNFMVQQSRQMMRDYAKTTLIAINECFQLMHGQLQQIEQQIVEKLREESLMSQMTLNSSLGQLNDYETVLMRMQHLLQVTDELPRDIWLKQVIKKLYEYIDKMPNSIKVTKVESNPFVFNDGSEKFGQYLQRKFSCQFNDPKINVDFINESNVSGDCTTSSQYSPMEASLESSDMNSSGAKPKFRSSKKVVAKPSGGAIKKTLPVDQSKLLLPSENSKTNVTNIREDAIISSFSALDIRQNKSRASVAPATDTQDWFKTDMEIRVRGITSPTDFYAQSLSVAKLVRAKLEAFAESPNCVQPLSIKVGQQYITYHTDIDRWHRAVVNQQLSTQDNVYKVFLPDMGIHFQVHSSNFRELPEPLTKLPYAAAHCSLKDVQPIDGGTKWSPQAISFFKELMQNKTVFAVVYRKMASQIYEVDLRSTNYNTTISLREAFFYTGLAAPTGRLPLGEKQPLHATQTNRIPLMELKQGDFFTIEVTCVNQPHEFYVKQINREPAMRVMLASLNSTMETMALANLEQIYLGRLHLGCVVQLDGSWQRGSIQELLPHGYVLVRLVDSGFTHKLYWDKLHVLPRSFWQSQNAIKCCLDGVETLQKNSYLWTSEATSYFKQMTANPHLWMEVIQMRDGIAHVALKYEHKDCQVTNVAARLVAAGHCVSCGASSHLSASPKKQQQILDPQMQKFIKQLEVKNQQQPQSKNLLPASSVSQQPLAENFIKVLWVSHPGEFYVTQTSFLPSIAKLKLDIQEAAQKMYEDSEPKSDWQVGEKCFLRWATDDKREVWHRGLIRAIDNHQSDDPTYSVQLCDVGQTVTEVKSSSITTMDVQNRCIAFSALRCQLSGIEPKSADGQWTPKAIEFFKNQITAFPRLSVSHTSRQNKGFLVTMWGIHIEICGPFSPDCTKHVNINKSLVIAGFAVSDENNVFEQMPDECTSLMNEPNFESLRKYFEKVDKICVVKSIKHQEEIHTQGNAMILSEDSPDLELLDDFNVSPTMKGLRRAPAAWLKPRLIEKTMFTAKPSYVNYDGEIYLTYSEDQEYMQLMRKRLTECFQPILELCKKSTKDTFVEGQPVVVVYHVDKHFYRGIVQRKETRHVYEILFVDYGNSEVVDEGSLLPYAPFPQLNAMTWRVRLHGIEPPEEKYTIKTLDYLHKRIVSKLVSVRVINPQGACGLSECHIKIDNISIADEMVENKMVKRVANKRTIPATVPTNRTMQFKMLDEMQMMMMDNQTASTSQPPAKKFLMNLADLQAFDSVEDVDCQKAANELMNSRNDNRNSNAEQDEDEGYDFNNESKVTEKMDESTKGGEDDMTEEVAEALSGTEVDDSSKQLVETVSIFEQISRRIKMRHKEITETISFTPLDSSTVRSYYDGFSKFKEQNLPTGIKYFLCTIDNVISSTELQISPCLSEFAKQNFNLAHDTRMLINKAKPLETVELNALCLALYSQDQKWYRAIIKELHPTQEQVTVFYIDFHNTEILPMNSLKQMPSELYMFPLRSFRVKLHGIKLNRHFDEMTVMQALKTCICKPSSVFARVHYPPNYHSNVPKLTDDSFHSSNDSIRNGHKLLEVDLYENKKEKNRLYEELVESWMYLKK